MYLRDEQIGVAIGTTLELSSVIRSWRFDFHIRGELINQRNWNLSLLFGKISNLLSSVAEVSDTISNILMFFDIALHIAQNPPVQNVYASGRSPGPAPAPAC